MDGNKMEIMKSKGRELTRAEVLSRLREVWELLRLDGGELTGGQMELVQYNLKLADLFGELQGARDFSSVSAIGFTVEIAEESDDGEDFEDE